MHLISCHHGHCICIRVCLMHSSILLVVRFAFRRFVLLRWSFLPSSRVWGLNISRLDRDLSCGLGLLPVDRLSSFVPFGLCLILQRLTEGPKRPHVCCSPTPFQSGPKPKKTSSIISVVRSRSRGQKPHLIWTLLAPSTYEYVIPSEFSRSPNPNLRPPRAAGQFRPRRTCPPPSATSLRPTGERHLTTASALTHSACDTSAPPPSLSSPSTAPALQAHRRPALARAAVVRNLREPDPGPRRRSSAPPRPARRSSSPATPSSPQ